MFSCWVNFKPMAVFCGLLPQRYLLSFMCFLGILCSYAMRQCLNISITVMVIPHPLVGNQTVKEGTCPLPTEMSLEGDRPIVGEFDWSQSLQGLLLSSFYWMYGLTHVPGGWMAQHFGGKSVLLFSVFFTAILTVITPPVTRMGGPYALLTLRILEGAFEGPGIPSVNVLVAHWAPANEKSFHGSLAFSGSLIGNVISLSLSGVVLRATHYDWAMVFYLFGGLSLLWCLLFWLFCYSDPWQHPFISPGELEYLEANLKNVTHGTVHYKTPWLAILTSLPVLGLVIAQIGHDLIFFAMVTDLPKYMNDVLHFPIMQLGFFASAPYLAEWIVALLTGWLADVIISRQWFSVVNTRRFFASFSTVGPSLGVLAASYAGCDSTWVVLSFVIGLGIMGTFYPGIKVNALDLSPNFAGIVMAVVNGVGSVAGIIIPYLIGILTPNSTLLEWRVAFFVIAGGTITSLLFFVMLGSGTVQPWNEPKTSTNEE